MKLTDIFRKKSEIEREITARKAAAANAAKALVLCDRLEKHLPPQIAAIEAQPVVIAFNVYSPVEDFTGRHDLATQAKQLSALRSLHSDLPTIRAHWTKVRDSLN